MKFDTEKNQFYYVEEIPESTNKYYAEAFIRYYNAFYKVFLSAFNQCEFSSLLTIFGVRGIEDAGWNPYKSSVQIIQSLIEQNDNIKDYTAQKNLHLWIYGHVMEASEPYEKIMNFLDIITGEQFNALKFPPNKRGNPQTPGQKIKTIVDKAKKLSFSEIEDIYDEIWDRELRNAVFHSDYCLFGDEVRIRSPYKIYSQDEINKLVNYAYAYFQVIDELLKMFVGQYTEPTVIEPHPKFRTHKGEKALVMVREGYGAIGIKDNWTFEDIKRGMIPYHIGNFYPEESKLMEDNPMTALFPKRGESNYCLVEEKLKK